MTLYINTVLSDKMLLALMLKEETIAFKKVPVDRNQAEKLLPAINKLLDYAGVNLKQIKKIIVADEGGSFTSLRIGVLTANALGYALAIPVLGESGRKRLKGFSTYKIVEPRYQAPPNIGEKSLTKKGK